MKRKTMALMLALSMCLSLLSACGSGDKATDDKPPESENVVSSTEQQPKESEKPEESEELKEEEPEVSAEPTQRPEEEQPEESEKPEATVPAEMTYTFDAATGTLTCSGGGEVSSTEWLDIVKNILFETNIGAAKKEVKKVVVEQGVTSLGVEAFGGCINLTEVVLPDTLTHIGERAFRGTALTGIAVPESVTELENHVFEGCHNLASVNLPDGLTEIPDGLFSECTSLASIEIPAGVTRIGQNAFHWAGLMELSIPEGVTNIDSNFIAYSSITSITLPSSLTKWGYIFNDASQLTDVTILCEVTMDNVNSLVGKLLGKSVTIHAPAGSVIKGYVNRQIQSGNTKCTFVPIS